MLFRIGCSDSGTPVLRISANNRRSRRTPPSDSRIGVLPLHRYANRKADEAVKAMTVAMPAPAMPSDGTGPQPNISKGTSAICRTSAAT